MKIPFSLPRGALAAIAFSAIAACGGMAPALAPVQVKLIGINDLHGNLEPPAGTVTMRDPANRAGTPVAAGGIAYLGSLIDTLRAKNPHTLVVGGGDLIGAAPMSSSAFHDEPTIEALGMLGMSVSTVGNHEFDRGRAELLRMQNGGCFPPSADGRRGVVGVDTCMNQGKFSGAAFQYLAANVADAKTGKPLLPGYAIREIGGVKIGFIGATLKETPSVVNPAGVAGLEFQDEVAAINRLVPQLREQGAAAIVVLLHQGGTTSARFVNDASCPGFGGDVLAIADGLDRAVDVVISGHTHQEYICHRADGKLLTQAGFYGRIATEIDLEIDAAGRRVLRKSATNHVAVNGQAVRDGSGRPVPLPAGVVPLAKHAALDQLVQRYAGLTAQIKARPVGSISAAIDRRPNAAGESALGALVADALLAATADAAHGPAQIAFTNSGGLRQDLAYDAGSDGHIDFGAMYAVLPFGNAVVTMDLSGDQIRRLLEQQWEQPQPPRGRVLQVSAGFSYIWDAAQPGGAQRGSGSRVVAGSMALNGIPLEMDQTYRVATHGYLAAGGDNQAVFAEGLRRRAGPFELDAFDAYFRAHSPLAPNRTPRIRVVNGG